MTDWTAVWTVFSFILIGALGFAYILYRFFDILHGLVHWRR